VTAETDEVHSEEAVHGIYVPEHSLQMSSHLLHFFTASHGARRCAVRKAGSGHRIAVHREGVRNCTEQFHECGQIK
jgi:hypothetical protein